MASKMSAEVVVVGTGVVGAVIAEQLLDAGRSVLMIEAGPRVSRGAIVENFRNVPLGAKGDTSASYPPRPWAPHPVASDEPKDQYLQLSGTDSYAQTFIRYAGGSTWHWAGSVLRYRPSDFRMKSRFGVGVDWPISYEELAP